MIKQVGWKVQGVCPALCALEFRTRQKLKGMGGETTDSDGSGRIWKAQQSWDCFPAAARSGQALVLI